MKAAERASYNNNNDNDSDNDNNNNNDDNENPPTVLFLSAAAFPPVPVCPETVLAK
jgi:hypothetical protein